MENKNTKILNDLKEYFLNTPREKVLSDWEETKRESIVHSQPSQSVSVEEAILKLIEGIHINKANFDSISESGRISGTLYSEIRRLMNEAIKIGQSQHTESDKLLSEARNIIHALSIMGKNQGWINPASGKQTLIEEMDLFLTKTANHK